MGVPAVLAGTALAGTAVSLYGQNEAAKASSNYYGYLSATSRMNADLTKAAGEANAKTVSLEEGEAIQRSGQRTRATIGVQKAAMVSGVGVGSRSGQDIVKDTLTKGNLDEQAIRMNAELKRKAIFSGADMSALNLESQAGGYDIAGKNVRSALPWQQAGTLLGGASQAGANYYMMSRVS